jgi:hypothetical protein
MEETMEKHDYEELARRNNLAFNPHTLVFTDAGGQTYMRDDDATVEFKLADCSRAQRAAEEALSKLPGTARAKRAVLKAFALAKHRQLEVSLFGVWAKQQEAAGRDRNDLRFGIFIREEGYLVESGRLQ